MFAKTTLTTTITAALLATMPALAQEAGKDVAPTAQKSQPEQLNPAQYKQRLRSIRQQLSEIQQVTMSENPSLKEKSEKLDELVLLEIKEQGVNIAEDKTRLKTLEASLRDKEIDEKTRQQQMQEYQAVSQRLMKARQTALQEPEVQTKIKNFRQELLAAMEAQDSDTRRLIAEMNAARLHLQQSKQNAAQ